MPVLRNTRHEKFAQAVFRGETGKQAYRNHVATKPVSDNVATAAGARLLAAVNIQARLDELKGRAANKAVEKVSITRAWVLEKLRKNALIALGEEKLTLTKAVKSRIKDEDGGFTEEIKTVELEVTDRDAPAATRAFELLGREADERPMFVERREVGLPGDFDDQTDDDLRDRFAAIAGSAPGGRGNSGRARAPGRKETLQ